MYNYRVKLHNGEIFLFSCGKTLTELLTEINNCSDGYMCFGEHIRQKSSVVGIDLMDVTVSGGGDSMVEEEAN